MVRCFIFTMLILLIKYIWSPVYDSPPFTNSCQSQTKAEGIKAWWSWDIRVGLWARSTPKSLWGLLCQCVNSISISSMYCTIVCVAFLKILFKGQTKFKKMPKAKQQSQEPFYPTILDTTSVHFSTRVNLKFRTRCGVHPNHRIKLLDFKKKTSSCGPDQRLLSVLSSWTGPHNLV